MDKEYYGITIGPIVATMDYTSTPAGLWVASYIFSYIARRLLEELLKEQLSIVIPSFDPVEIPEVETVGSYPDHIIFYGETTPEQLNGLISSVKQEVAAMMADCLLKKDPEETKAARKYFSDYLSVKCIKYGTLIQNMPIIEVSNVLDAVELTQPYIFQEDKNYILEFFNGKSNEYLHEFVKRFPVAPQTLKHMSSDSGYVTFKKLEDIAKAGGFESMKFSRYFAIVYADGDNMSKSFRNMKDQETIETFSRKCIEYTKKSSEMIRTYGGVTIYAGGDDLLFIAPLLGAGKQSVFELCRSIKDLFAQEIVNSGICPSASVSFGVSINYHKFPLYEAMNQARSMLFGEAKTFTLKDENGIDVKNNLAVRMTKASGQSLSMVFRNDSDSLVKFLQILHNQYLADLDKDDDQVLERANSVIYAMENHAALFRVASENGCIQKFFENLNDNPNQNAYKAFIREISSLYSALESDEKKRMFRYIENDDVKKKDTKYSAILRLAKFYLEKAGDSDE